MRLLEIEIPNTALLLSNLGEEEGEAKPCSTYLDLQGGQVVCLVELSPFSLISSQRLNCPPKFVWSKYRGRCVRTYFSG